MEDEYDWHWEDIQSETGDTLELRNVTESKCYKCMVVDAFGNNAEVGFIVGVIDPNSAKTLALGEPQTAMIEDDSPYELFTFTPDEDGVYAFYSLNDDGYVVYGTLFDADWGILSSGIDNRRDDDYCSYCSYKNAMELKAGTQYYYVEHIGGEGTFFVRVDKIDITPLTLNSNAVVNISEPRQVVYFSYTPTKTGYYEFRTEGDSSKAKEVEFFLKGDLYYYGACTGYDCWLSACFMTAGTTYYFGARYDGVHNPNATGAYEVKLSYVEGLAGAEGEQETYEVEANTPITLKVIPKCTEEYLAELSYTWYHEKNVIDDATTAEYAITATCDDQYSCTVRDVHDHVWYVYFNVVIKND